MLGAAAQRILGTGGIFAAVAVSLLVVAILGAWHLRGRRQRRRQQQPALDTASG